MKFILGIWLNFTPKKNFNLGFAKCLLSAFAFLMLYKFMAMRQKYPQNFFVRQTTDFLQNYKPNKKFNLKNKIQLVYTAEFYTEEIFIRVLKEV